MVSSKFVDISMTRQELAVGRDRKLRRGKRTWR